MDASGVFHSPRPGAPVGGGQSSIVACKPMGFGLRMNVVGVTQGGRIEGRAVGSGGVWLVAAPCLFSVFYAPPLQFIFDCLLRFTQAYPIGYAPCNSDSGSDPDNRYLCGSVDTGARRASQTDFRT
eukprot:362573-Chlamydomonas_euryale.AAC.2